MWSGGFVIGPAIILLGKILARKVLSASEMRSIGRSIT